VPRITATRHENCSSIAIMHEESRQPESQNRAGKALADEIVETAHVPAAGSTDTAVLRNRTAFVAGGSRGVGASVALALARAGAHVAVNFRENPAPAEELCRQIGSVKGVAFPVQADVNDAGDIARAIAGAGATFGRAVDILVNCVGGLVARRPFVAMCWDDVQLALDLNLRGAFHCCQAVLPGMIERKSGWIVNIGSIVSWTVPPMHWSAYAIAKLALKNLTRSLALEAAHFDIRVNMVSPGLMDGGSNLALPDRMREVQALRTPLRRLTEPADIAEAVLFLCSPASRFITGADIPVCGGAYM
jgi:3-oxoacyl-[acyl-carrier protein] reductase